MSTHTKRVSKTEKYTVSHSRRCVAPRTTQLLFVYIKKIQFNGKRYILSRYKDVSISAPYERSPDLLFKLGKSYDLESNFITNRMILGDNKPTDNTKVQRLLYAISPTTGYQNRAKRKCERYSSLPRISGSGEKKNIKVHSPPPYFHRCSHWIPIFLRLSIPTHAHSRLLILHCTRSRELQID